MTDAIYTIIKKIVSQTVLDMVFKRKKLEIEQEREQTRSDCTFLQVDLALQSLQNKFIVANGWRRVKVTLKGRRG